MPQISAGLAEIEPLIHLSVKFGTSSSFTIVALFESRARSLA